MTINQSDVSELLDVSAERVAGKRVLVTGGTTGIGRATALLLASQGAHVFVFGREHAPLDDTLDDARRAGYDVEGLTADQAHHEDVRRVFAEIDRRWGGLDVLINNAAIPFGPATEATAEEMQYVVDSNLVGYLTCTREAIPRMRDGGDIVNVGSMSADERESGSAVYGATKAGIQAFSEGLRKEIGSRGIRVCLIEPGRVDTEMQEGAAESRAQQVDRGEMLRAEDVAAAILFCLTRPRRAEVVSLQIRPENREI